MFAKPQISRIPISKINCSLQDACLSWWRERGGVAELDHTDYLALTPHLQLALRSGQNASPRFFYVGEKSFAAQVLGDAFTTATHAGEWWDDGGYADAVSEAYEEASDTGVPVFEDIKATIKLPDRLYPISEATIHYRRLCLRTSLENGQETVTVITERAGETILKRSF